MRGVGGRRLSAPARLVVFDCDSTLSAVEGIDELAGAAHAAAVAELTAAAMRGELPLEAVYGRRLELIRPTRSAVAVLGELYVSRLVEDAAAVVTALQACGIEVRIMSGGLLPAVRAVARAVGVDADAVAAVDILFDDDGGYAGFDASSPLARAGGKLELLRAWRAAVDGPVVLVGDGATDLEAAPATDLFVAYAGVAARDAVVSAADAVVRSASLAPVLPLVLGGSAPAASARSVYDRGMEILSSTR